MPQKCHWCQQFYLSPYPKISLCSHCSQQFNNGKCHPIIKKLRPNSHRDRLEIFSRNIQKKSNNFLNSQEVSEKVTSLSNFSKIYQKILLSPFNRLTPLLLYNFLNENGIWMLTKDALILLNNYRGPMEWKYIHAICPRIIDKWNMTVADFNIGVCYYQNYLDFPKSIQEITYPNGKCLGIHNLQ